MAVSARPALPNTCSTSGTVLIMRSVNCSNCEALPADSPGSAVGMYNNVPSSIAGMNSLPSLLSGTSAVSSSTPASTKVAFG